MRKRSRFLNLSYLINTIAIKTKALELKLKRGQYPYSFYNKKSIQTIEAKYILDFQNEYISLSYFNYKKAVEIHGTNSSITQEIIIALAYYNECLQKPKLDKEHLLELASRVSKRAAITDNEMIFYLDEPYAKFDLTGKYFSGIIQGKAASLFLRCFLLTKDEKYKLWAKKCLLASWKPIEEGGILISLSKNMVWIEEYPSPKPSMVLNGFLFYIIGLSEYLAFENDDELRPKLDLCLNSAMAWIPKFRLKKGILYSMYRWSLCNVHYTGIMTFQFKHLYALTNISLFNDYQDFTSNLTNWKTFRSIT